MRFPNPGRDRYPCIVSTFILLFESMPDLPDPVGVRYTAVIKDHFGGFAGPHAGLFSFLPPLKPGVPLSTMKAVALSFVPQFTGTADHHRHISLLPCVIQFLVPLIAQSFCIFNGCCPHIAGIASGVGLSKSSGPNMLGCCQFGRILRFCSSLPKVSICPVQSSCAPQSDSPTETANPGDLTG